MEESSVSPGKDWSRFLELGLSGKPVQLIIRVTQWGGSSITRMSTDGSKTFQRGDLPFRKAVEAMQDMVEGRLAGDFRQYYLIPIVKGQKYEDGTLLKDIKPEDRDHIKVYLTDDEAKWLLRTLIKAAVHASLRRAIDLLPYRFASYVLQIF